MRMGKCKTKRRRSGKSSPGSTPHVPTPHVPIDSIFNRTGTPPPPRPDFDVTMSSDGDTPEAKRRKEEDKQGYVYTPILPPVHEVKLPEMFNVNFDEHTDAQTMFTTLANLIGEGVKQSLTSLNEFKIETYLHMDKQFHKCHERINQSSKTNSRDFGDIKSKLDSHITTFGNWKNEFEKKISTIESGVQEAQSLASAASDSVKACTSKVAQIEASATYMSDVFDQFQPEIEDFRLENKDTLMEFEAMKAELAKLKNEQNLNNRKSRELNLRMFNLSVNRRCIRRGNKMVYEREDTREVVINYLVARDILPNRSHSDYKELILVAHRTGKDKDTDRQIIMKVKDMDTKLEILRNFGQLKKKQSAKKPQGAEGGQPPLTDEGEGDQLPPADAVFIVEDLSPDDLVKRNWANDFMKEQRKNGKTAHFKFGTVMVDKKAVSNKDVALYYESVQMDNLGGVEKKLREWADKYIEVQKSKGSVGYIKGGQIYIDAEPVSRDIIESYYLKLKLRAERQRRTAATKKTPAK